MSALRIAKLSLLTYFVSGSLACAQVDEQPPSGPHSHRGVLGIGVTNAPVYMGADHNRTFGIPIGEYHWANGVYVGGGEGVIGVRLSATPSLQLGLALGADSGRKESDSVHLSGMGDIASKGIVNIQAKWAFSEGWAVGGGLQLASGTESKGGLLKMEVSYSIPVGPTTNLNVTAGATFANASYMQDYFGVNDTQASASGYRPYTASSGLRDTSLGIGLMHQINRNWMLMGGITSTSLSSIANDSPLVRKSTNQTGFAALAYNF